MAATTKKRPANGRFVNGSKNAGRNRGGASLSDIEMGGAVTKSKRSRVASVTGERSAAQKQSRSVLSVISARDVNGNAAGHHIVANEGASAGRKNSGHSNDALTTKMQASDRGGNDDRQLVTAMRPVSSRQKQAAGREGPGANESTHAACRSIQELQRHRCAAIKMQVAGENRIIAHVATMFGYRAGLNDSDRKKRFADSRKLIKQIVSYIKLPKSQEAIAVRVRALVVAAHGANRLIQATRDAYEAEMESLAMSLPVLEWIKSVRGFGVLNLAIVVGEAGDLSSYASPAKLWRRLGLAPFKGSMGSTHRRQGGLSKEEWTEFGYSPRRRSQLHLLAANMVMQNDGEYRKRYDESKQSAKVAHPDWSDGHLHAHGMLLALKRLIRDLWRNWNKATEAVA